MLFSPRKTIWLKSVKHFSGRVGNLNMHEMVLVAYDRHARWPGKFCHSIDLLDKDVRSPQLYDQEREGKEDRAFTLKDDAVTLKQLEFDFDAAGVLQNEKRRLWKTPKNPTDDLVSTAFFQRSDEGVDSVHCKVDGCRRARIITWRNLRLYWRWTYFESWISIGYFLMTWLWQAASGTTLKRPSKIRQSSRQWPTGGIVQ